MSHSHDHSHHHHDIPASTDENVALLAYMLHHNEHHAEELHELAHNLDGDVSNLIHEAVSFFEKGNEKLAQALERMQKEG
ncbi:MAG: cobalt transporter [Holdemanella sp.]|nr:cobalt transporter [Holdemanella sp.]